MDPLRVVSLGGGVQSTAMLLMGLAGEFGPPPDIAIFADVGWEPPEVYAHVEWLVRTVAPFPIVRLHTGDLRQPARRGVWCNTTRFQSAVLHAQYAWRGWDAAAFVHEGL